MRLIDADEYDRELQIEQMKREDGSLGQRFFEASRIDLANRPTVPAVPLDKLCEWLAKFANPCKIGIRCYYSYDNDRDCMPTVECWRYVLTKWMEGLDV